MVSGHQSYITAWMHAAAAIAAMTMHERRDCGGTAPLLKEDNHSSFEDYAFLYYVVHLI